MSSETKVLIYTLWERKNARGNTYLSGFLGKARGIGFRGEPTANGTPTWDLYLQPGKEQEEGGAGRAPTAMRRTGAQRWELRQQNPPADSVEPFCDDPIDEGRKP
jgi:hypothetical protein